MNCLTPKSKKGNKKPNYLKIPFKDNRANISTYKRKSKNKF